jgi:hypothetical protein
MMEEDDDDDDIPTILVGGEEVDITDVTPDIIARMTTEEMERYNQVCTLVQCTYTFVPVQLKKLGRRRTIWPQAGRPPPSPPLNHLKKCSNSFCMQIIGPIFAN